jgi:hypothetical protein
MIGKCTVLYTLVIFSNLCFDKMYMYTALKHHPDKNVSDKDGATRRFKAIAEAYQVLNDVEKRAEYDKRCQALCCAFAINVLSCIPFCASV